ncbi:MAG: hypothetical protein MJ147_05000 [Clostridia bacterium]|nr:hypothetical protein [Clostridia bacterium]
MSNNETKIGENAKNNTVFQGNIFNINSNKAIIVIITIIIVIIIASSACVYLLLTGSSIKSTSNSKDIPSDNISKAEILKLYEEAQKEYQNWIGDCIYCAISDSYEKPDAKDVREYYGLDNIDYYPVIHSTVKSVADVKSLFSKWFVSDCDIMIKIEHQYTDWKGKLYSCPIQLGDNTPYVLSHFSIKKVSNNEINLIFTYSYIDGSLYIENDSFDTVNMVYQNGKWMFKDGFDPTVNLNDPIIRDNGVTLKKINDNLIVVFDEPRMGTVANSCKEGLVFRSSPEDNSKNVICTYDKGSHLKVLGYYIPDRFEPKIYAYVTNGKKYGYVYASDGEHTYFEYKK